MKLNVKLIEISTGDTLVGLINHNDAEHFDLHPMDRIKVKKGSKVETIFVDIAKNKIVEPGKIGLYKEVSDSLKVKNNDSIEIIPTKKPLSLASIKKKLDGEKLSKEEIEQIVWDIVHNKLSHVELTYFVSACYTHKLSLQETVMLTKAMASEGETLKLRDKIVMDKHCVGGVAGNRTTMIVVPIIAAAGLKIPKTSSRSITSPAGTADTMEILSNVDVPLNKMKSILQKTNGCIIWGGSLNLAPADDKIIKVEKPLSIDAKSQLLASVMSKKLSVSATHLLIDIPWGKGSKIENKKHALTLKKNFEQVAKRVGIKAIVVLTDGKAPIGNGIGPLLEARDVLWVLEDDKRKPRDLYLKSIKLAGIMLELSGKAKKDTGFALAKEIVDSGLAYKKMVEIIRAQGKKIIDSGRMRVAPLSKHVYASKSGKVTLIHNDSISKIARTAGAPKNSSAGIYFHVNTNDEIKKGTLLYTIYAESSFKLDYAFAIAKELGFGVGIR
tara:strand:+ start:1949 stop:3442 length:1494 start_codon:yes stop_codon:yes gene_type:complete